MKICAIADTHQNHNELEVEECDVFIFAGDMTKFNWSVQHYVKFNNWLGTLPCKNKICIAGNHDTLFQKNPKKARDIMTNCIYLEDEEIIIDGIKFYGSPWQITFFNWAFNLPKSSFALKSKWDKIPKDVDVLITHSPPYQVLDYNFNGDSLGCELLLNRVFKVQPKLHFFGHIHEAGGQYIKMGNTVFCNVSMNNTKSAYKMEIINGVVI